MLVIFCLLCPHTCTHAHTRTLTVTHFSALWNVQESFADMMLLYSLGCNFCSVLFRQKIYLVYLIDWGVKFINNCFIKRLSGTFLLWSPSELFCFYFILREETPNNVCMVTTWRNLEGAKHDLIPLLECLLWDWCCSLYVLIFACVCQCVLTTVS